MKSINEIIGDKDKYLASKFKNTMKYYLMSCDVGEGIPSYEFVIKAKTLKGAETIGRKILKGDYPENWDYNQDSYSIHEVTAEELLDIMTIN